MDRNKYNINNINNNNIFWRIYINTQPTQTYKLKYKLIYSSFLSSIFNNVNIYKHIYMGFI
jgi:hypothetical protein